MGGLINASGDKMPPAALYDACRVMAKYVKWNGGLSWNFGDLHTMDIDPRVIHLVETYLQDVLPPEIGMRTTDGNYLKPHWSIRGLCACFPMPNIFTGYATRAIAYCGGTKQMICAISIFNIRKQMDPTRAAGNFLVVSV